jgi:hypothetical protein
MAARVVTVRTSGLFLLGGAFWLSAFHRPSRVAPVLLPTSSQSPSSNVHAADRRYDPVWPTRDDYEPQP